MAHFKNKRSSPRRNRHYTRRLDMKTMRAQERALLSGARPRRTWWKMLKKHQIPFEID